VAQIHDYKRLENSFIQKVKRGLKELGKSAADVTSAAWGMLTRSYTVVLVPHSEKKVYNLHITGFSICCFFLIAASLLGGALWLSVSWNSAMQTMSEKDSRFKSTQANLDQIRDEIANLLKEVKVFEPALTGALSASGTGAEIKSDVSGAIASAGDISSFFDINTKSSGTLREVEDVRRVSEYLATVAEPVKEIGALLNSQSDLFTEIPSIWPIQRSYRTHISQSFGYNRHPFTGLYYIHTGIDLSTYRSGDPVMATADGEVVLVEYDALGGYGNQVVITHKHGFKTRYAHLQVSWVRTGDRVQQGDIIGLIGNTGLSTGPHLHYEVRLGSDVVDPYKYLNMRSGGVKPSK